MKLLSTRTNRRGLVWVVVFFFIGVLGLAAYFLWRIFHWHPNFDITHGNGDPENPTNSLIAGEQWLQAQVAAGGSNSSFFIPALGVAGTVAPGLPVNPREVILSSTNFRDWQIEDIGWLEACDEILTNNRALPMKFYWRKIVW